MSDTAPIVALPAVGAARITAAVQAVIIEDGVRAARLRTGAAQSVVDQPTDLDAARWFQSLVELSWLVASADGFDPDERSALAELLELVTGQAVDHEALELNFVELEVAVDALGRRERLARAAAEVHDQGAGDDALAFAALVAMADGRLELPELDVLIELGGHLTLDADRVRALVGELAHEVEARLR